ncbi:hypothetical protein DES37_10652 [Mangrovibacter plantisponsor]|uniref:Uncharacterized protein n=1 Tax=Mangrovibacter plantisponsor TaxID=451513 RepID=A0A317Q091_9ENTR|nr:hypothetical protein DES37_10652 [Mangrovibacter plantisponsor]
MWRTENNEDKSNEGCLVAVNLHYIKSAFQISLFLQSIGIFFLNIFCVISKIPSVLHIFYLLKILSCAKLFLLKRKR